MKEALFYQKLADKKVKCELCPHNCLIINGHRGICRVRENHAGVLYSLVYGRIISEAIDPIEKKPLFHFLPGSKIYSIATAGCNFRCDFCQNFTISQLPRDQKTIVGEERTPEEIVEGAVIHKCQSLAYTYTEPTIFYEFAFDTAKLAHEKGLKNIFVTNGFTSEEPIKLIAPYLDAANVDLKSFSDEYYKKYCGAHLTPILENLKLLKKLDIWIEVTTLLIPGLNDSTEELTKIAQFIKNELDAMTPWHVSAFRPTYKMLDRPATPLETLIKAREIGLKVGLKFVYPGNISISGAEDTYCPKCQKAVIIRSGYRIKKNEVQNSCCSFCQAAIAGIWSTT